MYLLLGNFQMERSNYDGAIQLFERGQAQMRHYGGRPLLVVSLVSFLVGVLQHTESFTDADRYPDGNLMISTSRFNSVCVKLCTQRVARWMQANLFSSW
jgi:hypothetical protein